LLDIAYDAVIAVLPKNQFGRTTERDGKPKILSAKQLTPLAVVSHASEKTPNVYESSRALGVTDSIQKYFHAPLLNGVKSGYLFALFIN
jgi:hypothetical protein